MYPSIPFLILVLLGQVDSRDLDRIVSHNEEAISRIRTFQGRVETRESQDGGKTWKTLEVISVVRDGPREYIEDKAFGSFFGTAWRERESLTLCLFTPSECRYLGGWDPKDPPREPLADEDVDRVRGTLDALPSLGPQGWSHRWKAQSLLMVGDKSLRELLQDHTIISFKKEGDPARDITWRLELRARPVKGKTIESVGLTFSAQHHYLISRQDTTAVEDARRFTGNREVVDFWDLGAGVVLPKLIRTRVTNRPGVVYECELKNVRVNEPIGRDLTLEFPEGAIVVDHRVPAYHIWGKGKPARTFTSDEFNAWNTGRQQRLLSRRLERKPWFWPTLGSVAATGVVLIALVVYRRRTA